MDKRGFIFKTQFLLSKMFFFLFLLLDVGVSLCLDTDPEACTAWFIFLLSGFTNKVLLSAHMVAVISCCSHERGGVCGI